MLWLAGGASRGFNQEIIGRRRGSDVAAFHGATRLCCIDSRDVQFMRAFRKYQPPSFTRRTAGLQIDVPALRRAPLKHAALGANAGENRTT